jgi:ketosteroid isomerase-like protein
VIDQFTTAFTHRLVGVHALGGTRHSRDAQERWFERLFRLLPDIEFSVQDVLVRGWPWRTRAVALVAVSAANGTYENEISQVIDIRWGRIERIHNLEDTQRLADLLLALTATGVAEAAAPPIDETPDG